MSGFPPKVARLVFEVGACSRLGGGGVIHVNRGAYPTTHNRDQPVCGRCSCCHPGKQWDGDEACRAYTCTCHRTNNTDRSSHV